jgi:hypothetical protein
MGIGGCSAAARRFFRMRRAPSAVVHHRTVDKAYSSTNHQGRAFANRLNPNLFQNQVRTLLEL